MEELLAIWLECEKPCVDDDWFSGERLLGGFIPQAGSGPAAKSLLLSERAEGWSEWLSVIGTKPREQRFETGAIFLSDGDESQAYAAAAFYMTNNSLGFDSALLNQKIELGGHAFFSAEVRSRDK